MRWYITVWLISFVLIRSVDYRSGIGSFSKRGSYFLLMKTYHKRLVQSIIHSLVVLKWNFHVQIDQRLQIGITIKTIKRIIECIWKTISSIQQRSRVNSIQRSNGWSRSSGGDNICSSFHIAAHLDWKINSFLYIDLYILTCRFRLLKI